MSFAATQEPELTLVPIERAPLAQRRPEGPGWFDSSWELRRGLHVQEDWPGDVALNGWLEKWLCNAAKHAGS